MNVDVIENICITTCIVAFFATVVLLLGGLILNEQKVNALEPQCSHYTAAYPPICSVPESAHRVLVTGSVGK